MIFGIQTIANPTWELGSNFCRLIVGMDSQAANSVDLAEQSNGFGLPLTQR
ncbi:hypothetical protein ROA7450_03563 [Roseovarius albus]|uniref:Uncharacterized protein n=1 Tax=Roseovarius albus TaxID=1247867 RepID=A0A1X7A0I9_9RHOB|nr:hypothetical protein ROA7450_03563 [Roseovarius albus]